MANSGQDRTQDVYKTRGLRAIEESSVRRISQQNFCTNRILNSPVQFMHSSTDGNDYCTRKFINLVESNTQEIKECTHGHIGVVNTIPQHQTLLLGVFSNTVPHQELSPSRTVTFAYSHFMYCLLHVLSPSRIPTSQVTILYSQACLVNMPCEYVEYI